MAVAQRAVWGMNWYKKLIQIKYLGIDMIKYVGFEMNISLSKLSTILLQNTIPYNAHCG